ncbi:E3 ubiquitin-protein ligase ATL42 [Bienertia sinuspersici]
MIRWFNYTLLIILITTQLVNAQDDHGQHTPTSSNFQPSLFVVIGVLSFMFTLTSILLLYARFCHRQASAIHNVSQTQNTNAMFGNNTRFSGIDKKVVESLPFFKFSSLKGSKQGLQCAVCLAEFEEVEILRLLPKCKHGFHIECVDLWLEHHSTCPLCRQTVSIEDLTAFNTSSSMRFMGGQKSDAGEDVSSTNFEVLLDLNNNSDHHTDQRSSRFSLGGSFRRLFSAKNEDVRIHVDQQGQKNNYDDDKVLHRLNHQIVVSDVVFKHRWSDVSSSDLMFLNSEMLGVMSNLNNDDDDDDDEYRIINLRDEIERKKDFEDKVDQIKGCNSSSRLNIEMGFEDLSGSNMKFNPPRRSGLISADKRSMSEVTALSRFKDLMSMKNKLRQCLADSEVNNSDNGNNYAREDVIKRQKNGFQLLRKQFNGLQTEKQTGLCNINNNSNSSNLRKNQTLDV